MHVCRGGLAGWWPEIVGCLAIGLSSVAVAGDAGRLQILTHELFRPLPVASIPTASKPGSGSVRTLKFDAYGRRFSLLLEANARLSPPPAPEGPTLSLYQGTIENVPGSWVRLSAKAQDIRGAIWDGRELYLVDSSAVLGIAADTPATETNQTIIFRLSDTQVPPGSSFCGDSPRRTGASGKTAYLDMVRELKNSPLAMRAPGANLRLEISALADALFRARYASDRQAQDEILSRINIVDGIYSSQLQIEIQVPTFNINDSVAKQLSDSASATDLIEEVGLLRERTPVLRARGLSHLFTGRDLEGQTVGIAYTEALCSRRYGVGLTQTSHATTLDALVAAHEIGHNFGAPHDGEKECAATPTGEHLMSPSVSQNATTFSECSLAQIRPRLPEATCLLPLTAPDLEIPVDLGTLSHAVGTPFTWELQVTNKGGSIAYGGDVTLWVPPSVSIDDAVVPGGTCKSGAGRVQCEVGDVPAGGSRVVTLTLRSNVVGSNSISARVYAEDDAQSSNNAGEGTLVINPEADLSVTAQAPASVVAGSTISASFTATNSAPVEVATIRIELSVAGGLNIVSGEIPGGSCTSSGTTATCTLPTLGANQSVGGTLSLSAVSSGTANLRASISGDYIDPAALNNAAEQTISVVSATAEPPPNRGGGGGGSSSLSLILALSSLLGWRRLRVANLRG